MTCSNCGTVNEPGRKFCKECGSPLAIECPACGAANAPDAKFCGECGSALTGAAAAAQAAAPPTRATADAGPSTERRLVSVLFADLVGFTSLSEHRDAEDVREMLSRYFEAARQVVERHGGIVEKFIGDAVMAVWGTPTAHEDDAERSVRAALELVDAVAALGRAEDIDLAARAGVLTGEAATTVGAVSQGIVTGDLVNTASRLQTAAEPGTVLVGEATYRAASAAIAFQEIGELALKGKDEAVKAWRALRVVGERGGGGRQPGLEPPFVGRTEEFRLLKELLHATEREGKARLVSVTGIGGIGKSRLAWELAKYIDGLADDIYWHQGRCPAYGDGVTFWALGEMIRMRARIAETDDLATSRQKLSSSVAEFVFDDEERRWIEPRLAHLLGLAERPSGERDELFSAWRTFIERIAERRPVVMLFEDLQWADTGLLDFIESVLEWSRALPILIVTLARPELAERRPDWGTTQRSFTSLRLEPLSEAAMTEMVERFVSGLPEEGIERIVARAEGIPLYAVETVRMLADRGSLRPKGDGYEVAGELGDLDIPQSLHALIAARLDALPQQDRALVQEASVLGKSFTVDSLAGVSNTPAGQLESRLKDLVRKEVISFERDPRSPERGQYAFLQSLIREVAYGTLAKPDRRRLHLAAAHKLEGLQDEELAGVVASHYIEAFHATPSGPDAEAVAARARDWLGQAADRASSLGSPDQALTYANQALEITPEGEERAVLLGKAGKAAFDSARVEDAIALLREAIDLSNQLGDAAAAGKLSAELAMPLIQQQRGDEAIQTMEAALDALGEDGDRWAIVAVSTRLSNAYSLSGKREEALACVERALPIAEALGALEDFVRILVAKAHSLFNVGRHREALILMRGALEAADELGNNSLRAEVLGSRGTMLAEDDPRGSLDSFLGAADAAKRAGMRVLELVHAANAAESAIDLADLETAEQLLRRASDENLPMNVAASLGLNRALLAAFRGNSDDARATLEEVRPPSIASGMLQMVTWFERTRAFVELLAGDPETAWQAAMAGIDPDPTGMNAPLSVWGGVLAASWAKNAQKLQTILGAAHRLPGQWIELVIATGEAALDVIEGRVDQAVAGFAEVLGRWERIDLERDEALAVITALQLLGPEQVPARSVERARAFSERTGMTPLLERLGAKSETPSGV